MFKRRISAKFARLVAGLFASVFLFAAPAVAASSRLEQIKEWYEKSAAGRLYTPVDEDFAHFHDYQGQDVDCPYDSYCSLYSMRTQDTSKDFIERETIQSWQVYDQFDGGSYSWDMLHEAVLGLDYPSDIYTEDIMRNNFGTVGVYFCPYGTRSLVQYREWAPERTETCETYYSGDGTWSQAPSLPEEIISEYVLTSDETIATRNGWLAPVAYLNSFLRGLYTGSGKYDIFSDFTTFSERAGYLLANSQAQDGIYLASIYSAKQNAELTKSGGFFDGLTLCNEGEKGQFVAMAACEDNANRKLFVFAPNGLPYFYDLNSLLEGELIRRDIYTTSELTDSVYDVDDIDLQLEVQCGMRYNDGVFGADCHYIGYDEHGVIIPLSQWDITPLMDVVTVLHTKVTDLESWGTVWSDFSNLWPITLAFGPMEDTGGGGTTTKYTCDAGKYLPANSTSCKTCIEGYYCPGGTWAKDTSAQGLEACPSGTTSVAGATSADACVSTSAITYKVTLDKQSGTGGISEYYYQYNTKDKCYYYTTSALSTCTDSSDGQTITVPTRTGYTFSGYYTGANGTGTMYVDSTGMTRNNLYKSVAANTTLYAYWTPIGALSVTCAAGQYIKKGAITCTTCPAGAYCTGGTYSIDSTGATDNTGITLCPVDTYNPSTGQSSASACKVCAEGTYTEAVEGQLSCSVCGTPPNTDGQTTQYDDNPMYRVCIDCNNKNDRVSEWFGADWDSVTNTVPNLCKIKSCKSGYPLINNTCALSSTYYIAYNANGGTGTTATTTCTYGQKCTAAQNGFTNGTKRFLGWAMDSPTGSPEIAGGQTAIYDFTYDNNTYTLYAIWEDCTACNPSTGANCTLTAPKGVCTYTTSCQTGYHSISNNGKYNPSCTANSYYIEMDEYPGTVNGSQFGGEFAWDYKGTGFTERGGNEEEMTDEKGFRPGWGMSKTGYDLRGWFTAKNGKGTQLIDSDGYTVSNLHDIYFGDDGTSMTAYIYWVPRMWWIQFDFQPDACDEFSGLWALEYGTDTPDTLQPSLCENLYDSEGFYHMPIASQTGYTFAGWYTGENGTGIQLTDGNGKILNSVYTTDFGADGAEITAYAKWTPNTYKVTLDKQSGTGGTSEYYYAYETKGTCYYYTSSALSTCIDSSDGQNIVVPTRTGYTFGGYYTGKNGTGTMYVDSIGLTKNNLYKAVTGNTTLYAKWTGISYTVKYDANGGTGTTASSSHTYGTAKNLTTNGFSNGTKRFLGWSRTKTATTATYGDGQSVKDLTSTDGATVTLYAIWGDCEPCAPGVGAKCELTVETGYCYYTTECLDGYIDIENDGEYNPQCTANMLTCEPGYYVPAGASECAICTNGNYCPGGEYLVLTEADNGLFPCEPGVACGSEGNKSFTKYNISYDLGTGATNNAQNPVQCGVAWSYDDSTWQLACSSVDKSECARPTTGPVSENPDYCTIAYDDGSQVWVGIDAADREGYGFYCWHNMDDPDNTCTDDSVRMDDYTYYLEKLANKSDDDPQSVYNIRLQAVWDAWEYDIKYNLNGGSNPSGVRTKYTIESDEYTLPTPTRTGYTFGGWYENSGLTGNAVTKIASGSTGTKTFWAKWNAIEYGITYNLDGGTNDASNPTKYTIETATITLAAPTKNGYTFDGWYTEAAFTNKVTQIAKGSTGDKTFYAKWTLSSVTCAAGQYLPANSLSCTKCTAGYACPGGTFEYKNTDQGITQCTGATYAGAGAAQCTSCPSPYTHDTSAGKTQIEQCTLKTSGGHCVITAGGDAGANCPYGYYCPGEIVVPYGSTGGTVACPDAIQNKPSKWPDNYHDVTKVALDSSWGAGGHAGDTIDNCFVAYDLENSRGTIFAVHSYNSKTGKYDIQVQDGFYMWYKSLKSGYYLGKKWTYNGQDVCQVFGEDQPKLYQDALPCPTDAYCPGYDGTIESSGWPKCGDGEYAAETGYCPAIASHTVDTWSAMYRNPTIVKASFYLDDSAASGSQFMDTGGEFGPCFAEYLLKNDAGTILTMQPYSVQTGKYEAYFDDAATLNFYKDYYAFYASLNPGYYFSKKWSRTQNGETIDWCNGASDGARLWQEAEPCPAGAYCPGLPDALTDSISDIDNIPDSWPKCGDTTAYTDVYNKNACPTAYANSAAKSSAIEQCYLTTTAGKYVATAKADQVQCLKNNYCAGGATVNYGSTGGMQSCATGYESAAGASSCTATEYAITYNLDGGTNNASNPAKYTIETTTITLANPTKTGYTFGGWYSDAALKTQVTQIAKGSTGAKIFYAKWTAVSYSITYNLNGGTNAAGAKTSYTIETADYTLPTPTKTGYTFGGWYENSGLTGSAVAKIAKGSTGNKTYWAKWTIKSVTCAAGKYLPANSLSCGDCGAGYACPGGTFEYKNTDQGISQCTGRTKYSASGASSCATVAAGYYATGCDANGNGCTGQSQCTGTTYCSGGTKYDCPSGYTTDKSDGKTAASQCTISVAAGKYLGTANGTTTTSCAANTYKAAHTVNYGSTSSCGACPADYPYSDAGAASADQCYKNGTNTGTRSEPTLPTGCAAQTTTACTPGTCTYRIYKSGTTTSCTPTNCVNTHKACTSAATDYYLDSGVAKGCSVLNSAYPKSDGGNITSSSCYGTFSKSGSQVNGTTPTNCSAVTAWNACTPGTCNYTKYASGTIKTDCTPDNCTKTVKTVTAKSGYYVNNNTSCNACSGLAGGFYPNSDADNTGGASACYTNSIRGKYVATINATSATNCAAGSYKGAHTVKYGSTSSCDSCPTGYTVAAGAGVAQTSCYISVPAGKYLGTAKGTTTTSCAAGTYKVAHNVNYGSTSSCTSCPTMAASSKSLVDATNGSLRSSEAAPDVTGITSESGCVIDALFTSDYAYWIERRGFSSASATSYDKLIGKYYFETRPGYYLSDPTTQCLKDLGSSYVSTGIGYGSVNKCDAGYYCESGATTYGSMSTCGGTNNPATIGRKACAGRTQYSASGAESCSTVSNGYYTTGCDDSGNLCTGQSQCTGTTYCSGGIQNDCPSGYTANTAAGKTAATQCTISVATGKYLGTKNSSTQTACAAGTYKAAHTVNYGSTSSCDACTGRTKYSAAGAASCSTVSSGYYTTGCTGDDKCTGQTQCTSGTWCASGVMNQCSSLSGVSSAGGTYSSAVGSTANTACKYTGPSKTLSGCKTVTTNTVTYTGTAWPATTYSVTANGGYIISNNNQATAACSLCTGATYSAGGTATSCTSCPNGYNANESDGKTVASQCQIKCAAKTTVSTANGACTALTTGGYYKGQHLVNYGSTSSAEQCPVGYRDGAAGAAITDCTKSVADGNYVRTANDADATQCAADTYKSAHTVKYGGTSSCVACDTGYHSAAGAASCTANTYTIAYNAGGGTGATANTACTYGQNCTLTANGFTNGTKEFQGWATSAGATTATYGNKASVKNLSDENGATVTLYAVWAECTACNATNANCSLTAPLGVCTYATSCKTGYGNIQNNGKYNASCSGNSITCAAGEYLPAGATSCKKCEANNYCPGGTFTYTGALQGRTTCPADYPYSDAGASNADQCYKNGTNTGTRSEPALPTGCAAQTTTACTPGTCTYRIYKSGTTTSCTPTNCVNTHKACTSASADYYLDSGVAKGCSVLNSAYPKSDGGNITSASCYGTFSKSGSQVNGTTPTNCSAVTAWNACTPGTCNYTKYASGTIKTDCTPTDCTKTVKTVTAKSGYYVNNSTSCSACSGLAGGFYPNSAADNTGGASACYTNSISGKYVATANATSATNCAAGSYKGAHTVNYGDTSSCALCATGYESAAGASSCSAIVYTITYELNGGAAATGNPATYTIETATITLAAPTKTGYTFGGWYADAAFKTPVTQIVKGSTGNKTLYAKWSGNTYTVTLNANGGTGGTTSVTATYNEQMPTLASVATMADFALVGYFDATTGGTKYYNADGTGARVWDKTSDATLFAQWLSDFISVKCDAGKYIATGATVCSATCVAGNYCPGGTFTIPRTGATIDTGINGCTGRTRYAAAGATSCGTVSAGYYTTGCTGNDKCTGQSQCTDATYCSGGIKYDCPTAYTANIDAGKTVNTQCQIKTTAGNYVSTAQSDQTTCTAGAYCPGNVLVNWGGTGGRTLCTAGTYNPNTGSSLAAACVKSDAGYYVGTNGATAQTACTGATYTDVTGATKCTTCPTATKYADALARYSYYNTGTIGDHTTKTKCQAVFNSTIDHGTLVNDACYLGSDDDYGTSTSNGASTCWLLKDGLSCDGGYYNKSQYASTRATVLSNACIAVGAGYWSATGDLTRTQCGTGLTTIGYGAGADEAGDCGRILSYGNKTVYLRSVRKTTPSLNVWMDGRTYYGNAAAGNVSGRIRVRRGDATYSVYDDSMQ